MLFASLFQLKATSIQCSNSQNFFISKFATIEDGLPPTNPRGILDLPALCKVIPVHGLRSFRSLIAKLSASSNLPDVTCIVSDGVMSFTLEAAQEFGIPEVLLFTPSGCGMLGYLYFEELKERGYFPLKDDSCLTNGYLDTEIDWIPNMKGVRLKDLPTFIRTTDPNDTMFNYNCEAVNNAMKAEGIILNTFDDLEPEVLEVIRTKFPKLYTTGPLSLLHQQVCATNLESVALSLWKENTECLHWLDRIKKPNSVVYVNYGSLVIITPEQLKEFAWGLANSEYPFLWVIRPDLVNGGKEIVSEEYMKVISNRGLLVEWCEQEKVLRHPSVGAFLTHCGWNSTLESICEGVPLMCWPFFAEQQTNCLYSCTKWGIGIEIDGDVKREKVERLVRELMEGEKGKEMRSRSMEWKKKAEASTRPGGPSYNNFEELVKYLKR
ncbi:Glycosyltransferase [Melia azedarach]|uniref:Glycosyltransferase n=1 Tax=Melia azedarach TaxID=155640 RepID=A0ACC1Y1J4_MELAZ|nr:Glycosyltransferase [Melia azedarach]